MVESYFFLLKDRTKVSHKVDHRELERQIFAFWIKAPPQVFYRIKVAAFKNVFNVEVCAVFVRCFSSCKFGLWMCQIKFSFWLIILSLVSAPSSPLHNRQQRGRGSWKQSWWWKFEIFSTLWYFISTTPTAKLPLQPRARPWREKYDYLLPIEKRIYTFLELCEKANNGLRSCVLEKIFDRNKNPIH